MPVAVARRAGVVFDASHFPKRLYAFRMAAGLTQKQLAERLGVKRGAVARWESGDRSPSFENVVELANVLGVDIAEFTKPPAQED